VSCRKTTDLINAWFQMNILVSFVVLFNCLCCLIHVNTELVLFQVLRVVRLIRASPMLEDFCFKVHFSVTSLMSQVTESVDELSGYYCD